MTQIVTINLSQNVAPLPADLQRKGAIISESGTTLPVGGTATLTEPSDLTNILAGGIPTAVMSAGAGNASVILGFAAQHHLGAVNTIRNLVMAGMVPSSYNGNYIVTILDAQTIAYTPSGGYVGPLTTQGIATPEDVGELIGTVATFFEQGNAISVDVIELGGDPNTNDAIEAAPIAAFGAWLTANPNAYYAYLVPKSWPDRSAFHALKQNFNGLQSKTYFYCTVSLSNYQFFTSLDKSCFCMLESPTALNNEHSIASAFYVALRQRLSATNKLTPFCYSYVYGVTPYPTKGNNGLLAQLRAANVNVIQVASEGGITNTMLTYGRMMDGRPLNYWYAVDWYCINSQRDLANEIINGSNNSVNPLYYNQKGIDRLEARFAKTTNSGVAFGCILGSPIQLGLDGDDLDDALDNETYQGRTIINAIPFIPYGTENPNDYKAGIYNGLSSNFVPQAGFESITVNMVISDFAAQ